MLRNNNLHYAYASAVFILYIFEGSGSEVILEENLHYVGCYVEIYPLRLLHDQSTVFKSDNSPSKCIDHCKKEGSKYAGLQFSVECYCSVLPPSLIYAAKESECDTTCDGNTQFICGGTNRLSVYAITDEDKQIALFKKPAGYVGCFKDSSSYQALKGEKTEFKNILDVEKCRHHCKSRGFSYAGLEEGFKCYCSNHRPHFTLYSDEEDCNFRCQGKKEQICGGTSHLSWYQVDADKRIPNTVISNYLGCYTDGPMRALGGKFEEVGPNMTPELCVGLCYRNNFKYAGAQFSKQCFCGNVLESDRRTKETECDMACAGNANIVCGGGFRNNVYQTGLDDLATAKNPSEMGCFIDTGEKRTLDEKKVNLDNTNTPKVCRDFCSSNGYKYSGVEFGAECFCGNNTPSEDLKANDFDCNMECAGDKKIKKCGGPFRIWISDATANALDTPSITIINQSLAEISLTDSGDRRKPCIKSVSEVNGRKQCREELLFNEDFSNSISSNKWTYEHFMPWLPDYEFVVLQKKSKNSFVRNGKLYIKPTLQEDEFVRRGKLELASCTGPVYSEECTRQGATFSILPPVESARITTKETFSFKYGKVEIRAKLPIGDWIIPEIWLEPKRRVYGPSYASGRIRIAMARGNRNLMVGNKDYGNRILESGILMGVREDVRGKMIIREQLDSWNKEFHNYTLIWKPDNLQFLVDGRHEKSIVPPGNTLSELVGFDEYTSKIWAPGSNIAPFDQDFYVSLGLSVGGMRDFPDDSKSSNNEKPWKNMAVKAMANFWQDRQTWYNTWQDDSSSLQVEHVRVHAL